MCDTRNFGGENSGIKNIKVNAVLMKGVNDDVSAFSEFAKKHGVKVRFIEMMPIMNEHAFHKYFCRRIFS